MALPQDTDILNHSRPMNVGQIVKKAQNFDYNKAIPLKYWLRTAGTLIKEVRSSRLMSNTAHPQYLGRDLRTRGQ